MIDPIQILFTIAVAYVAWLALGDDDKPKPDLY